MRIVQINAVNRISSTGRSTYELHLELQKRGYESYVFCCNEHIPKNNIYSIGSTTDHKIHALFSRVFGLQGYFSTLATNKAIRQLKLIIPNIVILGNLHGNFINLPKLLSWLAENDIPTVVLTHDCWFFTGHCCHYTLDRCNKWLSECHNCPILHKYNKSLFFDRSRKIFNDKKRLFQSIPRMAVVGVSDWITNEAKRSPIFSKAKIIKRLYNWIDVNKFRPLDDKNLRIKLGFSPELFIVLGVAQGWSNDKGLDVFIELAKKNRNLNVLLVGKTDVVTEPLPNLQFIGPTDSVEELVEFYNIADVFLSPSLQETFGKVAAEALACGTPIIVNNATAMPEIANSVGYIVNSNNIQEIISAIESIKVQNKAVLKKKCRESALSRFSMNQIINDYIILFNELQNK